MIDNQILWQKILKSREKWTYNGSQQPKFAIQPKQGEESVRDYPRPPKIVEDFRDIRIYFENELILKTSSSLRVLETAGAPTFCFYQKGVNMACLESLEGQSICEWKGQANYYGAKKDKLKRISAWSYKHPFPEYQQLKGMISFYPSIFTCLIESQQVKSQPGNVYGGWVSVEIVGPIKGKAVSPTGTE